MTGTIDCEDKSVAVYVDGVEVPTVDTSENDKPAVSTKVRTDGPADITRLSDIQVPARWRGEDVFEALPLDPNDEKAVPVNVQMRPPRNSNLRRGWGIVHGGWLRKIGSGGDGRLLRMKVSDYANLAKQTPFTETYEGETSVQTIMQDVIDRLNESIQGINITSNATGTVLEPSLDLVYPSTVLGKISKTAEILTGGPDPPSKSFSGADGDTVVDVMNWLTQQNNVIWWFEPLSDVDIMLVIGSTSAFSDELRKTTQVGGDHLVRHNSALYNINPVNRVTAVGERVNTGDSISSGNSYITASATHTDLFEASGGNISEMIIRDSFGSITEAAKTTRSRMKEVHSESNEGELLLDGFPQMMVHNRVEAQPVCGDYVDGSVPSLTYQVKEVIHEVPANGRYATRTNVGISSTDDEIITEGGLGNEQGDIIRTGFYREDGEIAVVPIPGISEDTSSVNL